MEILESVDTVLSAPPLPSDILGRCKIFLFTTSSQPPATGNKRLKPSSSSSSAGTGNGKAVERVVGCLVVQPIRTGMRVLQGDDGNLEEGKRKRDEVVVVGEDAESAGDASTSSKAVICSYVPPYPISSLACLTSPLQTNENPEQNWHPSDIHCPEIPRPRNQQDSTRRRLRKDNLWVHRTSPIFSPIHSVPLLMSVLGVV